MPMFIKKSRLIACFWFSAICCATQPLNHPFGQPKQNTFVYLAEVNTQFPGDRVYQVMKGSLGFLWVGSDRGLLRYDSRQVQWYRRDLSNPSSLQGDKVNALFEDSWGQFWIGTQTGLHQMNRKTGVFKSWQSKTGNSDTLPSLIWSIGEDSEGHLLVGTDRGLYWAQPGSLQFQQVPAIRNMGITAIAKNAFGEVILATQNDGIWTGFSPEGSWDSHSAAGDLRANSLVCLGSDVLIGTWNCGLVLWQGDRWQAIPRITQASQQVSEISPDSVTALTSSAHGEVWVGYSNQLAKFSTETYQLETISQEAFDHSDYSEITALKATDDDLLWVATNRGGLYFKDFRRMRFKLQPSIDMEPICIFQDRQQRYWVGTTKGLFFKDHKGKVHVFLADQYVYQINQLETGEMLAVTDSGIHAIEPERNAVSFVLRLSRAWSIAPSKNNQFWLSDEDGLYLWSLDQGVEFHLPTAIQDSKAEESEQISDIITSIAEDGDGNVWLGTYTQGLKKVIRQTKEIVHYSYDPDSDNSLSSNSIIHLRIGPKQNIWMGTQGGGLNRLDPKTGKVTRWTTSNGLPDNAVAAIVFDGSGMLWSTTGEGLVQMDPSTQAIRSYSDRNGFNLGAGKPGICWVEPNGTTVSFGGTTGLVTFDTNQFKQVESPNFAFTNIVVDNNPGQHIMLPGETLVLGQPKNSLSLDAVLLDFRNAPQQSIRFRREFVDDGWSPGQLSNKISYTSYLPLGGVGTLEVMARANDSTNVRSTLTIDVKRPGWLAWVPLWVLLGLALLIAVIYAIMTKRMRKHQQYLVQQAELAKSQQALAEERAKVAEANSVIATQKQRFQTEVTKVLQQHMEQVSAEISNDIHDGPLGALTGVAFRLHQLEDAAQDRKLKQVLTELSHDTIPNITNNLRHVCGELLKPNLDAGLETELAHYIGSIQDQAPHLKIEFQANPISQGFSHNDLATVFRISRTLLKNVVKHANANKVEVSLGVIDNQLTLVIADDGCGFELPNTWQDFKEKDHFGLYMANYFAQSSGGVLQVVSQVEAGTHVQLTIPREKHV